MAVTLEVAAQLAGLVVAVGTIVGAIVLALIDRRVRPHLVRMEGWMERHYAEHRAMRHSLEQQGVVVPPNGGRPPKVDNR